MTPDELLADVQHQQVRVRRRLEQDWFTLAVEGAALGVAALGYALGGDHWGTPVMVVALAVALTWIGVRQWRIGRLFAQGPVSVPLKGLALSAATAGGCLLLNWWLGGAAGIGAATAWCLLGVVGFYLWLRESMLLHLMWLLTGAGLLAMSGASTAVVMGFYAVAMIGLGAFSWHKPKRLRP